MALNGLTFTDENEWIEKALSIIENADKVALSGGKTPIPVYEKLKPGNFWLVDERYVPITHENSNAGMIQQYFPIHHFDTSLEPELAVEKYAKEIPDQFDLIVLGIGKDGHTASLFPNSPTLDSTKPVDTAEGPDYTRLTLTFPTILKAKKLLVLLRNKPEELHGPSSRLLEHPDLNILLLAL